MLRIPSLKPFGLKGFTLNFSNEKEFILDCGELSGTFGCFKKSSDIRKFYEDLLNTKNISVVPDNNEDCKMEEESKIEFFKYLIENDISCKILKPNVEGENTKDSYIEEYKTFQVLNKEVYKSEIKRYTTYALPKEKSSYLHFILKQYVSYRILLGNNKVLFNGDHHIDELYIILFTNCETDLFRLSLNDFVLKNIFYGTSKYLDILIYNIGISLRLLHKNKDSHGRRRIHGDIKFENIVLCTYAYENNENLFKFIDYSIIEYTTLGNLYLPPGTYFLPKLDVNNSQREYQNVQYTVPRLKPNNPTKKYNEYQNQSIYDYSLEEFDNYQKYINGIPYPSIKEQLIENNDSYKKSKKNMHTFIKKKQGIDYIDEYELLLIKQDEYAFALVILQFLKSNVKSITSSPRDAYYNFIRRLLYPEPYLLTDEFKNNCLAWYKSLQPEEKQKNKYIETLDWSV